MQMKRMDGYEFRGRTATDRRELEAFGEKWEAEEIS
jgi:hypothetical protein